MTSEQIRTKPFLTERKGGYNKDEVVAFLEEVADQFEALQSRIGTVEAAGDPEVAVEVEELRSKAALLDGLQEALEKAYADVEELKAEVARARQERDSVSQRLAASADPTAAIGEEVAMVLRSAKEAANELHARAERETAELRARAERETNELRADAESTRADADRAAAQLRADAETQADAIISRARREADDLLASGRSRYDELLAAQSEVSTRLSDAESVLRSVRERLSDPAPLESPAAAAAAEPAPFEAPSEAPAEAEPQTASTEESGGFGVTAADWFSQPEEAPPAGETPSDEVQEFAG